MLQHEQPVHRRIVFSSSSPATPPALDAQSNVAVASIAHRSKTSSEIARALQQASGDAPLAKQSHERQWRNFLSVRESAVDEASEPAPYATTTRPTFADHGERTRATFDDPHVISSASSSSSSSSSRSESPLPAMTTSVTRVPSPSIEPTASPSASYRRITTLAAAPQPSTPLLPPITELNRPAPPAQPKVGRMHSDPDAMWKAFVFGDVSPTRNPSTGPLSRFNDTDLRANVHDGAAVMSTKRPYSSLQARASESQFTGTRDDSSIIGRDPDLGHDDQGDARTDFATQIAGDFSPVPARPATPANDVFVRRPTLQPSLPTEALSSSPDPLVATCNEPRKSKVLFSPPKRFAVPVAPESVDTGRDVVRLGGRGRNKKTVHHKARKKAAVTKQRRWEVDDVEHDF